MTNRIITDISNFIFISDTPVKSDAIFLPGGSHPEQPEYAAELYKKGFAKWVVHSGGVSVKRDKWPGVRSKADIYDGDYKTDCEFFADVLIKNGVPPEAIVGEDKSGHLLAALKKIDESSGIVEKKGVLYSLCGEFEKMLCMFPVPALTINCFMKFFLLLKKLC